MNRFSRIVLAGLGGLLPAIAQIPQVVDKAFFSQEPKILMKLCSDESIRLNTKDTHLLAEYGDTQLALGNRAGAEAAFAKAALKSPNDAQTHHLIGLAWLRKGFKKEALAAYAAMVNVDLTGSYENRKNIFTKAALDLIKAGEVKLATEYMEAGYRLDKGDAENFIEFGRAALLVGERELSATYFTRAVKADGKDVDVWLGISNAYADLMLLQRKSVAAPPVNP